MFPWRVGAQRYSLSVSRERELTPPVTTRRTGRGCCVVATCLLTLAAVPGCSDDSPLGPTVPGGATEIGGPPMASAPPLPPGWDPNEVVPRSQRDAQDTVKQYLERALKPLPAGTVLDATRYGSAGHNSACDDEPRAGDPLVRFHTTGDLKLPSGTDAAAVIGQAGDIWRSWGWYVLERDGFPKPNRFGYGSDGYRLQIEIANPPNLPPTLMASSPCFSGDFSSDDDIPFPIVLPAN